MAKIIPVGIDLGTTLSAVSYIDSDGKTQMIRNTTGGVLTPSAVLFDDDNIIVGAAAWEAAAEFPGRVAENAKRDVGAASYRHKIVGQQYPPEVIQGCILRQLRHDIMSAVGDSFQAVVTVPAYFDEARRKITADAGAMSGLPVLDIVNEPTAAALAFGERLGYLSPEGAPEGEMKLVVYDLGGGTFDVTVMELAAGKVRTLSTDGDYELGGIHWDARLAEYAEEQFRKLYPNAREFDDRDHIKLARAARAAKHDLSAVPATTLRFTLDQHELKLPVTRDLFESLSDDLVERTVFTTNQALRAAGLLWDDIDRLLLVGGSTRMLAVRSALQKNSGLVPDDDVHPDEAVARGAAVYCRYQMGVRGISDAIPKLRVTDVNSHGLGIEGVNQETMRVQNVTVIPRNTPLPYTVTRQFVTKTDNQRSIKIQLLEGESSLPDQCSPLASAGIKHLPPGLPKGTPITVTYTYDTSGRLSVNASVEGLGDEAKIELDRVRGLPATRIDRWKKVICRDGGYQDFEEAVASMLISDDVLHSGTEKQKLEPDKPVERKRPNLDPAVEVGAPQAASERLWAQARGQKEAASAKNAKPTETKSAASSTKAKSQDDDTWPPQSQKKTPAKKPKAKKSSSSDSSSGIARYVLAGILGAWICYYGVCLVWPQMNLLGLPLPGVSEQAPSPSSTGP
ncbi:Hsp70 family protein [Aeoliella mucimassa]|uniref:Chaperone protein DnaK n=1 Tax=Aeoliella mucimassa TaxID=2527972 RepID=A0A518AUN3_9BACT|nr:Hsp70 family protein [Aeoliella mucimassa]QDU58426.1 Chaperone protein DnaK [Aeoliella mucimassa]